MTDAEFHQQQLEYQSLPDHSADLAEMCREAVLKAPFDSECVAVAYGIDNNKFRVVDMNGKSYMITVEAI
jgi:hypothetical protein